MEGRTHTGVLLVFNSSCDPTRTAEWNRWYVDQHMPEVLGTGAFDTAARFRLADGFEFPAGATHMAVYETSRPSVPGAMAELSEKLIAAEPTPRPPSSLAHVATYTKISEHGDATGKRANGVVIVLCDCPDPAQEDAFNEWYEHHGPHILENMAHYAVTRYVADEPKPWQAKYLAIYETEDSDPGRVQREGWEWYFSLPPEELASMPPLRVWCETAYEREV